MASDSHTALPGTVFTGSVVSAGVVRCHPSAPAFAAAEVVDGYRFVFPRLAVWIKTSRARRYVSNPSVVEYYNDGDEYSREPLDPRGDSTEWFAVSEPVVRDIVARHDPAAADARRPFRPAHGPTDRRAYAAQRLLSQRLSAEAFVEPLEVEERVLALLDASLSRVYGARGQADPFVTRNDRDIAERATAVLSRMTHRHVTLAGIGREAAVSVFHLSRIFRRVTGQTLAQHHLHLRLLTSLEPLLETDATISVIARQSGFASHSHFSSVFRRLFGLSPSALRALPARARGETLNGARARSAAAANATC
ncbi:MAG TPA: helix-turn-helix transcriptional regulator [Vicinamibacterales bacterium]|nr:helix-turn-helix transcriptional regulator [Vicinamibacterales bacterium]